jgi:hypothetical protein
VSRREFSPGYSLLLGGVFALPMALGATWLGASPYRILGYGVWALVAAWGVHLVASLVLAARGESPQHPPDR